MSFISKLVSALKPQEYAVRINSETTTKAAARKIRTNRQFKPLKGVLAVGVAALIIGGGASTAFAATATNASTAKAGILEDSVCINAESGNSGGQWSDGSNRYAKLGGRTSSSMAGINQSNVGKDTVLGNFLTSTYNNDTNKQLTAYEKYGAGFPQYEGWIPAWTDDHYTFTGSGPNGELDGGTPSGNEIAVGQGLLLTNELFACIALPQTIEAGIANFIAVPPRILADIGLTVYGASYGQSISNPDSLLYPIGEVVDTIIIGQNGNGGLQQTLFLPFLIPLILVGACYLAYVGIIKKRFSEAAGGMVWMVLAITAGTFFLTQPTLISSYMDDGVSEVQTAINGLVTPANSTSDMCAVRGGDSEDSARRGIQCTVWFASIYAPWVSGQFGTGINQLNDEGSTGYSILTANPRNILNNPDYSIQYGNKTVQADNWAQFMVDRQSNGYALQLSEVAYAELSGAENTANGNIPNTVWKGGTGSQVFSALLLWVSVPASNLVLLVFGIVLLFYQLLMISAVIMSPFVFLLGVVPGFGKSILLRYAELLIGLLIKRIVTSLVLAIYFVFYIALVTDVTALLLPLQIILVVVLAIFALSARSRFSNLLASQVNFGGNKSMGFVGARGLATGAGIAAGTAGLLGGGVLAGLLVGRAAKKSAKSDVEGMTTDKDGVKLENAGAGFSSSAPTMDVRPRGGSVTGEESPDKPGKTAGQVTKDGIRVVKDVKDASDKARQLMPAGKAAAQGLSSAAASGAGGAAGAATSAGSVAAVSTAAGAASSAAAGAAAAGGATAAGTAAGAAAGSAVPVAGTLVGAAVGAAAGKVVEKAVEKKAEEKSKPGLPPRDIRLSQGSADRPSRPNFPRSNG